MNTRTVVVQLSEGQFKHLDMLRKTYNVQTAQDAIRLLIDGVYYNVLRPEYPDERKDK